MPKRSFADLKNTGELKNYLNNAFQYTRKNVYHYTSIDALLGIISSRELHFSSFETANDVEEYEFVSEEIKNKFFFSLMRTNNQIRIIPSPIYSVKQCVDAIKKDERYKINKDISIADLFIENPYYGKYRSRA